MQRDEEIFAAAVELSGPERAAFVARECGGDHAMQARVSELLEAHDSAHGFMGQPAAPRPAAQPAEQPGDLIGNYKLLQRIGEGGVGVVWMARQEIPFRRHVALKVIKLGMDTEAVIARFEGERQALARMDHPNIAQVFDAGTTAGGRPFFVMELVRGAPITTYCDEHRLTTSQRIELFIAVCGALQHAHQKGIIHRDLKPSNILVTENGAAAVPKVIDFGIAKATQGSLAENTVFTAFEHFIGTPTYMSPEQAGLSSLDLDTRSDIYSLGVLLFELLTGHTPFDKATFLKGGIDAIRQRIREEEPARPSARLGGLEAQTRSTVAERRCTAPHQLAVELRGDLDWIVMRCLEKDRTRRYESASALADDLRRFLRNEPVSARPPTAWYVARKLVRRNRAAVATAAIIASILLAGGGISTWQAVRATRAEREQSRLRTTEADLRRQAQQQADAARRRAYAADMNLAQQALATDNVGLAKRLLNRQRPAGTQPDLRGWEWRYLWQLTQSEAVTTLAKKPHPVSWLDSSPDGRWVAVGQADGGDFTLINVQTRQEIKLPAGIGPVRGVFSPTAPLLAYVYTRSYEPQMEHRVRLWDLTSRQVVAEWSSPYPAGLLAFSADGQRLTAASMGRSGGVVQWRIPSGEVIPTTLQLAGGATAISRDAALLATEAPRGPRRPIQILDVNSGRALWSLQGPREGVTAVAFSEDGSLLASAAGNTEPTITLWNAKTGTRVRQLEGHRTYIADLLFLPDGKTLASAGTDQTVRLWDVESGEMRRTFRGHELEVHSLSALRNQNAMVSGAKDGAVLLWDLATPATPSVTKLEPVSSWAFAPDGQSVLTADFHGILARRYGPHWESSDTLLDLGRGGPGRGRVQAQFAASRPLVAVWTPDEPVRIYDYSTKQVVASLETGAKNASVLGFTPGADKVLLLYVDPSADQPQVHEWDIAARRRVRSWRVTAGISYAGRWLTLRAVDSTVTVRDLVDNTEWQLPFPAPWGVATSSSPDNRLLAIGSTAGWVRVWDTTTKGQVADLSGFILGVHATEFSADGRRLVAGSGGVEAVRMWDVASFEPLLTLSAEGTIFASVAFSPDGNVIGAKNIQNQLFLWRAPPAAEIEGAERPSQR